MKTKTQFPGCKFVALILILAVASGCASLPPVDDTKTVYLQTDFMGYRHLEVDVDGDPSSRPGAMAAGGMQAAVEGCGPFFLFCAVVTVPTAAAAGAVVTAIETLPEEQAHALNHVTTRVVSQLGTNLDMRFDKAMRDEAARQDVVVKAFDADVALAVYVSEIRWNVGVGNNVAINATFVVNGKARNGETGQITVKYVSESATVPEWVAGTGERIEEALVKMVDEATLEIWQRILSYGEEDEEA